LAQPRKKKRPRYSRRQKNESINRATTISQVLQQPFPIPISSLTGIEANNSVWRWYKGNLKKRVKERPQIDCKSKEPFSEASSVRYDGEKLYYFVEIESDNEAHTILAQMGFFGETEESLVSYRSVTKSETKHDTYVSLEDFEPKISMNIHEKNRKERNFNEYGKFKTS